MKYITLVLPFLCACSLMESKPKEDEAAKTAKSMEMKLATLDENYRRAIDDLARMNRDAVQQMGRIEQRLVLLESTQDRLREQITARPAGPVAHNVVPAAAKSIDQAARLSEIASMLKDPAFNDLDKVRAELTPIAAQATGFLMQEIRRNPSDLKLVERVDALIGSFPFAEVKAPMTQALRDPQLRVMAAWTIGRTANPEFAPVLREFTTEPDPSFQIAVGVALVQCRDKAGIPFLLKGLGSDLKATRILAIQHLKRINRGEDYAYDWNKSPAANGSSITQWEAWWAAFRDYDLLP
jgi:hypothetical protein